MMAERAGECTSGAVSVFSPYVWFNCGFKFMRQSTVTPGRNSHISYVNVTSDPEVGRSLAQYLARQWYVCCVSFGAFGFVSRIFYVKVVIGS